MREPPVWSVLPAALTPPVTRPRVLPYLAPLAIVVGLFLVGARTLAVVVFVAAAIVTIATSVSPPARDLFDRGAAWLGHRVGTVLTVALLGLVQLVVFFPISLLAKMTRSDPMDPFDGRPVESRWLSRSRGDRTLHQRQYADEGYRRRAAGHETRPGSPRWIRGAVGGLALLLLADVALGSAIVRLDRDDPTPLSGPIFGFDPLEQEALRDQAGARELMAELSQVGIGKPDPFTGWRFVPGITHESETVNVVDRLRATLATPIEGAAIEVWMFGGSTLYGSGQSDDATIPSELVRLAAADDVAINVTNFGHPAYAQWQQVQLLIAELTAGTKALPDVVVFYDGFNDLTLQTQRGVHQEPTHLFFDTPTAVLASESSVASTVRTWWADHSATSLAVGRVRDAFDDEPAIQVADIDTAPIDTIDPIAAAEAARAIHRRGVDLVIELGEAYGFEAQFFWQPYLYTKDPLTPAETDLIGLPGYDTDVWLPMTDHIRAGMSAPVVDLSDALDGIEQSLFWDFVHTNEAGARLVAEAIYPYLSEALTG